MSSILFFAAWLAIMYFNLSRLAQLRHGAREAGLSFFLFPVGSSFPWPRNFATGVVSGHEVACSYGFFGELIVEARPVAADGPTRRKVVRAFRNVSSEIQLAVREVTTGVALPEFLDNRDATVRLSAMSRMAGRAVLETDVPSLLQAGEPRLRLAAANFLGAENAEARTVAQTLIGNRSVPEEIRAETLRIFAGVFENRESILDAALDARTPHLAVAAIELECPRPARLEPVVTEVSAGVRGVIARELAKQQTPAAEELLIRMLKLDDEPLATIDALGTCGTSKALEAVFALRGSRRVRAAADAALVRIRARMNDVERQRGNLAVADSHRGGEVSVAQTQGAVTLKE